MNRQERRAHEAQHRKAWSRADIINLGMRFLAVSADTATGMTLLHPDGTVTYVSRETADTMAGDGLPRGRA